MTRDTPGVERKPPATESSRWRSLEELADDPRSRTFLGREFPEGASELPEGISRRSMVMLLGASMSMAGLAGCRRPLEKIVPYAEAPEQIIPGVPRFYATTMSFQHSALGLVVTSMEGRPTKIEGNELHPSSKGATHVFAQASILGLYDPDRSKDVMHGDERAAWTDFVAAWQSAEAAHLDNGGRGLAVLSESFSSPTLARLARQFRERFPKARWVVYEPVDDENIYRGLELATGEALRPVYEVGRAKVILSLDADFLSEDGESVRHSLGFAEGRRIGADVANESMNRLYAVEGCYSLTGANADHRLRLGSGRIAAFVGALAAELAAQGLEVEVPARSSSGQSSLDGVEPVWLEAVAADLVAHRGDSLIVAGRRQPAEVHAAVHALNAALDNDGTTVSYRPLPDAARTDLEALRDLVSVTSAGQISDLLILGGNPEYNAPADLDIGAAIANVANVVHLGSYRDESGALSHWHVPEAHFLESWNDARAADGTLSVVQPMIEPLFGGKSSVEVLGLLASGDDRSGHDLVRETWRELMGYPPLEALPLPMPMPVAAPPPAGDGAEDVVEDAAEGEPVPPPVPVDPEFEKAWNRVLHDGLLVDSELPGVVPAWRAGLIAAVSSVGDQKPSATDLEIVFQTSPAVFDGRWANNGWLQELPDAMTKLTWDNAALLSPATAAELNLANEDVVRLRYEGRELELPVWIMPGQADFTVAVTLGYGRQNVGRIADGVGGNAYTLRTSSAPDFGRGLSLEATGRRYALAQTQDHHRMEGRPIVREATLEVYKQEPEFAKEAVEKPHENSLWEEWAYDRGHQWGMTVDLNTCTGCNACVIACQSENNVPVVGREQVEKGREMHWLRIDRYFAGSEEDPETVFQAVPCMQCENAPCEQVCPVAATVHDAQGLNVMVYNRCIGTRYCSNNCPYKVRRFNFYNFTKYMPPVLKLAQNPDVTVRSRGVMEKCTYCVQRIHAAQINAKLEDRGVRDGEIRTACQQACPTRAIEFGNLLDPESRVVARKAEPRNYGLLDELHTKPRTTYLAKLRNPNPTLVGPEPADEGHEPEHAPEATPDGTPDGTEEHA